MFITISALKNTLYMVKIKVETATNPLKVHNHKEYKEFVYTYLRGHIKKLVKNIHTIIENIF